MVASREEARDVWIARQRNQVIPEDTEVIPEESLQRMRARNGKMTNLSLDVLVPLFAPGEPCYEGISNSVRIMLAYAIKHIDDIEDFQAVDGVDGDPDCCDDCRESFMEAIAEREAGMGEYRSYLPRGQKNLTKAAHAVRVIVRSAFWVNDERPSHYVRDPMGAEDVGQAEAEGQAEDVEDGGPWENLRAATTTVNDVNTNFARANDKED